MKKRFAIIIAIIVACTFSIVLIASPTPVSAVSAIEELKAQIAEREREVKELEQKVAEYREHLTETKQQSNTLQYQISSVEKEIAEVNLNIKKVQTKIIETSLRVEEIKNQSGKQFDPALVEHFVRILPDILTIREQYPD